MRSHAELAENS